MRGLEGFVLVGQQYLADPTRSVGNVHPLWTYAHVPHGCTGDATGAIVTQIERFAPGFRDRIVGTAVRSTTELATYNPNYIGGDIIGGASSLKQLLFRPRFATDPYATGIPGTYLCSASTPLGCRSTRDVRCERRSASIGRDPRRRIASVDHDHTSMWPDHEGTRPTNQQPEPVRRYNARRDGLAPLAMALLSAGLIAMVINHLV